MLSGSNKNMFVKQRDEKYDLKFLVGTFAHTHVLQLTIL